MNKLIFIFSLVLLLGGCYTDSEADKIFKKGVEKGIEKGKKEGYEKCEIENLAFRQKAGKELNQLSVALDEVERQKRHYEITELWKALYAPDIALNNIKNFKLPELSIWHIPFILFFLITVFGAVYIMYINYKKTRFNEVFEEAKKAYERIQNEEEEINSLYAQKEYLHSEILDFKKSVLNQEKLLGEATDAKNSEKRKADAIRSEIRSLEKKRDEIKKEIDRFSM